MSAPIGHIASYPHQQVPYIAGALVGADVGRVDGALEGATDGLLVTPPPRPAACVGALDGTLGYGWRCVSYWIESMLHAGASTHLVGALLGALVGAFEGERVGAFEGERVGATAATGALVVC